MKSEFLIFAALTMLIVSGCSLKKDMEEMHDATVEMKDRTKNMDKNTEAVKTTSDDLKRLSTEMYHDLRQGDSLASRKKLLNSLKEARNLTAKFALAAEYFMSFEFQLWSSIEKDTPEVRDELAKDAVQEFIREVQEFIYPGQTQPEPFAVRSSFDGVTTTADDAANRQQCLNVLAAAMQELNPKQKRLLKLKPELEAMSMFSIFKKALEENSKLKAGVIKEKDQPAYATELMKMPHIYPLILQARYNELGFGAVYRFSPIGKEYQSWSLLGGLKVLKLRTVEWNVLKMKLGLSKGWSIDFEKHTPEQVAQYAEVLGWGQETRDLMKKHGLKPALVPALGYIMKELKLTPQQKIWIGIEKSETAEKLNEQEAKNRASQTLLLKSILSYGTIGG